MLIVKFLIFNLFGFFTVGVITFYADNAGLIPSLPPDLIPLFRNVFFAGTLYAWIFGALISTLFFFVKGTLKTLFLLLPLILPFLYGSAVLYYFN